MSSTRCAACKYLRRRCGEDCTLAPYFPPHDPLRFESVHRIYGAANVASMLQQMPIGDRADAADSLAAEAYARVQNPVYGIAGVVYNLHQQMESLRRELAFARAQIDVYSSLLQFLPSPLMHSGEAQAMPPPPPPPPPHHRQHRRLQHQLQHAMPPLHRLQHRLHHAGDETDVDNFAGRVANPNAGGFSQEQQEQMDQLFQFSDFM